MVLLVRSSRKEFRLESRMGIQGGSNVRYTLKETTPVMHSRLCELEGASWVAHSLSWPVDWGSDIRCHIHCCNCESPRCWLSLSDEDAEGARRFPPSLPHPHSSPVPSDPPSCLIAIDIPVRPWEAPNLDRGDKTSVYGASQVKPGRNGCVALVICLLLVAIESTLGVSPDERM